MKYILPKILINISWKQITRLSKINFDNKYDVEIKYYKQSKNVERIIFKPFKVGDFIEAQGVSGTVKEIGVINTKLNTFGNQLAIIPNGTLANDNIINYSAENTRRENLTVGISYDSDIRKAKAILLDIVNDFDLLVMARRNAFEMVSCDPMLAKAEHKNIRRALLSKFGDTLGLADVA